MKIDKFRWVAWAFLVAIVAALGLVGGPGTAVDERLVRAFHALAANRALEHGSILITYAGSAFTLVPLTLFFAVILFLRGKRWDALVLLVMALGGRLLVEVLKILVDRPRPVLEDYPVTVSSMSFPSGHAANTMTSFLAFALILAAARHRRAAIAVAVAVSVVVGLTRPLLGVHWPSDVLAGWLVGITWILLSDALVRRDRSAA